MSVIRGSSSECLQHYAKQERHQSFEEREKVRQFVHCNASSVLRWFRGPPLPKGLFLMYLRLFLVDRGYQVTEIEELDPLLVRAFRYLQRTNAKFSDVFGDIGLAPNWALEIFMGRARLMPETAQRIEAVLLKYGDAGKENGRSPSARTTTEAPESDLSNPMVALLAAVKPLAQHYLDQKTPEERRRLRSRSGKVIFEVSNLLSALCSEQARAQVLAENTRREA